VIYAHPGERSGGAAKLAWTASGMARDLGDFLLICAPQNSRTPLKSVHLASSRCRAGRKFGTRSTC